ncbi:MAG: hypothetical protein JXA21_28375 [Anaerolineae bacterium]|nr:hypothetical protein [Anaerolineae bacterium]
MGEPLSVDDLVEKKQRRFLKGAGIGLLVLAVLVAAMRVYLRSQVDASLSLDIFPENFSEIYYYQRSLLPNSFFAFFLWQVHTGIVQPLLFPAYTKPFVPYLGAAIVFAILGGCIASSNKPMRWFWLIVSTVAAIGYVGLQFLIYISGMIALD